MQKQNQVKPESYVLPDLNASFSSEYIFCCWHRKIGKGRSFFVANVRYFIFHSYHSGLKLIVEIVLKASEDNTSRDSKGVTESEALSAMCHAGSRVTSIT
jgi:hypothetical protein